MVGKVSINIVTLLFLLIPGLFGMKAFLQAYIKLDDLSRFDKLAVIMTIGSFALAIPPLALNWDCWSTHAGRAFSRIRSLNLSVQSVPDTWCSGGVLTFGDVMTTEQLSQIPLFVIILFLAIHTAFVSSISYTTGWIINKVGNGPLRESKYIEQPWEYASKKTARESDSATVITTENEEIRGTIHRIGSPSQDYDILLKDPEKVIRDEQTDTEVDTRDLGAFTYHHYRDISRIRFPNLDTYEEYEIDLDDASKRFVEEVGADTDNESLERNEVSDEDIPPRSG